MGNETRRGKLVIVTGASKGIGRAIAEQFAAEGNSLLLCARNEATLQICVKEMQQQFPQASVDSFAADLSDKLQVQAFAAWCLQQGSPAILVNNAGTFLPGNIRDEAEGSLEHMMNTNLYSAYHLTRLLLPAMLQNGSGHIFNISSIAALHAYDGGGSYSISKFALDGFSQNLRHELKATGIKVTTVFPGAVHTDSWAGFDNSSKRIMEASDVATMVLAASKLSAQAVVEQIVLRPQLGDL